MALTSLVSVGRRWRMLKPPPFNGPHLPSCHSKSPTRWQNPQVPRVRTIPSAELSGGLHWLLDSCCRNVDLAYMVDSCCWTVFSWLCTVWQLRWHLQQPQT